MIRSAPVTAGVVIVIAGGASWWFTSQLYAARFEGQKETILALEGRIKAKDDDLARKLAQITDFEKRANANPAAKAGIRDPNGLYQAGAQVGIAHGAIRDIGSGTVSFALLDATGDFNPSADFDYQELTLHMDKPGTVARIGGMGIVDRQRFGQVLCRIVSRRQ